MPDRASRYSPYFGTCARCGRVGRHVDRHADKALLFQTLHVPPHLLPHELPPIYLAVLFGGLLRLRKASGRSPRALNSVNKTPPPRNVNRTASAARVRPDDIEGYDGARPRVYRHLVSHSHANFVATLHVDDASRRHRHAAKPRRTWPPRRAARQLASLTPKCGLSAARAPQSNNFPHTKCSVRCPNFISPFSPAVLQISHCPPASAPANSTSLKC